MSTFRPPYPMPVERQTTLYLNGDELLRLQATPVNLDEWAAGFLFTEGIIGSVSDLLQLRVNGEANEVWAAVDPDRLAGGAVARKRYLTSGCGRGVTFSSLRDALMLKPVQSGVRAGRSRLIGWVRQMERQMPLYGESGGMHAAALVCARTGEMVVREDVGRHNALDKAIGAALRLDWPPAGLAMLTTGRISYEMCAKLARSGVGLGVSITAATDQAIRLATRLGIDLVGYARSPEKLTLYTAGDHIE